jgi:arylsulfatase A-like enzyme
MKWAFSVLAVATAVLAASVSPSQPQQAQQSRPNVVLILLDDARYDDMVAMPHVQARIGAAGATLSNAYSPFPLCCPARATLLTGQYAHNHGVLSNVAPTGGFKEFKDASTLATWLDPTYRTALVGKYFNAYAPPYTPPGWNEWMVPRGTYAYTGASWYIKRDGVGGYQSIPGYQTDTMGTLSADFVTRASASEEPYFLHASLVAPHDGTPRTDDPSWYVNPSPFVKSVYRNRFAGQRTGDPSFNEANVRDKPTRPPLLTQVQIDNLVEQNAQRREAELSAQDAVNTILDAVDGSGEGANTYVVFMSDNGYILGEHRIPGGKVEPYEVANHVPFLVRGPGIDPGTVVDDVTSQVDFAPTVLSMAGVEAPAPLDGIDLLPRLTTDAPLTRDGALIEATNVQAATGTDPLPWAYRGVVSGDWKFVNRGSSRELYNLAADPYELTNLAGRPAYADVQRRLAAMVAAKRDCAGTECH